MEGASIKAHVNLTDRGFVCLNITQFLGALNDNLYKWLVIFLLISLNGVSAYNTILAIAGALSVVPFVTMSSLCGKIADNYSKTTILRICKVIEIGITLAGVLAFSYQSEMACYGILFLLFLHSTLFSPAKYGILPELFPSEEVPLANGWLSMLSNVAIIMGGCLAAWITDKTEYNFVLSGSCCVVIAILGTLTSLGIPYVPSLSQAKPLHFNFISEIAQGLKRACNIPFLRLVLIGNGLFYAVAAYCQLNVVAYAMRDIGLSQTAGGYLSPAIAIGVGLGAMVAGRASKGKIRLDFLWKAGVGVSTFFALLFFATFNVYLSALCLFFIGFSGGFYVVPTDSFVQIKSPDEHRGEIIGTANVLAFTGVFIGSILIYVLGDLLNLLPKEGFVFIGLGSLILSLILKRLLKTSSGANSCSSLRF